MLETYDGPELGLLPSCYGWWEVIKGHYTMHEQTSFVNRTISDGLDEEKGQWWFKVIRYFIFGFK